MITFLMLLFMFIKFIMINLFSLTIALSSFYRRETDFDKISLYRKNKVNINMIDKKFKYRHKNIKKHHILINKDKFKKNKITIAVSYATDNEYIYPSIVSMTSLVYNTDNKTFYNIYILHPPDLTEKSKEFLNSVEENYFDRCSIIYFNMGNKYQDLFLIKKLTTPAYYRISLPDILPEVNRIIYLDSDTLVFEDLKELIELDMKGNLIMGYLDSEPDSLNDFGFKNATVLNTGVLLMNLDGLRKYDYPKKIEDFISQNKNKLYQQDQTIINAVIQGRIAPLPPKYGMWALNSKIEKQLYLKKQLPHLKYDEQEFFNASEHPAIVHFIWPKPFWKMNTKFYNIWWDFAKLTGFFWDIYLKSPIQKR